MVGRTGQKGWIRGRYPDGEVVSVALARSVGVAGAVPFAMYQHAIALERSRQKGGPMTSRDGPP
jgi:hypothetical protein